MTGGEVAQIITSLATLIAAVGAILIGLRNSTKIEQVHKATNSLTDRLVETTKLEAHAEGLKQGRDEKRPRPP